MALRGVTTVERRLEVLKEAERTGETVTEVCRRNKISRQTYYRYKRLFEQFGIDGLEPVSRRPFRSPVQMDPELCQGTSGTAQLRPRKLPSDGHEFCPRGAVRSR